MDKPMFKKGELVKLSKFGRANLRTVRWAGGDSGKNWLDGVGIVIAVVEGHDRYNKPTEKFRIYFNALGKHLTLHAGEFKKVKAKKR